MSGKLVTSLALAGIILAVIVGIALLAINARIATLKAGRAFTTKQGQAIYSVLRDKLPANFRIMAYGPTGDGVEYGSQLEKLLVAAGWRSQSVVPLIVAAESFSPRESPSWWMVGMMKQEPVRVTWNPHSRMLRWKM